MGLVTRSLKFDTEFGEVVVEVQSNGKVLKNGRVLKQSNNGADYLSVLIGYKSHSSGRKTRIRKYVHRLVAEAFIPNPDNLPQVNHKDFNKTNNFVDNLEWISRADNIQHSHDNGRMQKRYEVGGSDCTNQG